jgi:hypothetical protein
LALSREGQEADGDALGSAPLGLSSDGADGLSSVGLVVAAGVLQAARAAIIASASKILFNMGNSSGELADACRAVVCWPIRTAA